MQNAQHYHSRGFHAEIEVDNGVWISLDRYTQQSDSQDKRSYSASDSEDEQQRHVQPSVKLTEVRKSSSDEETDKEETVKKGTAKQETNRADEEDEIWLMSEDSRDSTVTAPSSLPTYTTML